MKRQITILLFAVFACLGAQNWETLNNTNHVYNLDKDGDNLYFSTWSGVVQIQGGTGESLSNYQEIRHWSTADGLVSNDIVCLAKIGFSESLWFGSMDDGISVVSPAGMQNLVPEAGAASYQVNRILNWGSTIYVASSEGLISYYYLPGVNFPLMLRKYTVQSTNGGLLNNDITDLLISKDNKLYLTTQSGVNYVHLDSLDTSSAWKNLNHEAGLAAGQNYLFSANERKLAIAIDGRVYVRDHNDNVWQNTMLHTVSNSSGITSILLDTQDNLWVSFGQWDSKTWRYLRDSELLLCRISPALEIEAMYENTQGLGFNSICRVQELDGKLYLCSWGDGIARLEMDGWSYYFMPNSIGFLKITQSMADLNHKMWFCSGNVADRLAPKGTMGVSSFDGTNWETFNIRNSPIQSDNILDIEADLYNRKWFGAYDANYQTGPWFPGITIYDERDNSWLRLTKLGIAHYVDDEWESNYTPEPRLLGNTITGITRDLYGNMFVCCYDDGVSVLDSDLNMVTDFRLKGFEHQRVLNVYHNGRQYFFGTEFDSGIAIWNDDSLPVTNGAHWLSQIPTELKSGSIHGVGSTLTPYAGWYHFVASSSGLYMWDEANWYRYDAYIKRYRYNFSLNAWENDTLYYEDEERLFGSISTVPNSIYSDPFGRVWIGSMDNGISMYDPFSERFTNYFIGNSPLLSNRIISLGYDPLGGKLLIGTPDGLNTLKIGKTVKEEGKLEDLKAFPNPFYADGSSKMYIVNLPEDSMPKGKNECAIYSQSGSLIIKLKESAYARFEWDGKNKAGDLVQSGIYYFVVASDKGKVKRGKIALIR